MNEAVNGFPEWIRVTHWINFFLMGYVIRAGIQILAAYPRLYWNDHCIPGAEWLKLTRKVIHPEHPWIALEQEETWSPWVAHPGGNNLGLGRHWHFASIGFWVLNGLIYVVGLFVSGGWPRLIPTSWAVFPEAWQTFLRYVTLQAPPACGLSEQFYETDARNDFVRGYALQTVAPLPIAMAHLLAEENGLYGEALMERMQDYNHYAAIGVLGEILPDERNFVSLHRTEKDQLGLPSPYSHFNLFENDRRLMEAGISRARAVLEAAGAAETHSVNRYAHLVGTCRMGFSAQDSVVDEWCRTWDVPNLFVCDGSVLPTQGSANPGLTISALAARTADWLRGAVRKGELGQRAGRRVGA